jgi:hypothetical protein
MRWVLPLVVASVALLSSPAAASWVRVKTDSDNDIYSVDVDLIEGRGRFRYFWSNILFESLGKLRRDNLLIVLCTTYPLTAKTNFIAFALSSCLMKTIKPSKNTIMAKTLD